MTTMMRHGGIIDREEATRPEETRRDETNDMYDEWTAYTNVVVRRGAGLVLYVPVLHAIVYHLCTCLYLLGKARKQMFRWQGYLMLWPITVYFQSRRQKAEDKGTAHTPQAHRASSTC